MISSLALAHTHTTPLALTLWDLLLHLHTDRMLRYDIFFCNCTILHAHTHTWCYVMMSFLGQNLPMDCSGKFWQSDNWPTTWKKDGKRAGLTICHQIIQTHHSWGVFCKLKWETQGCEERCYYVFPISLCWLVCHSMPIKRRVTGRIADRQVSAAQAARVLTGTAYSKDRLSSEVPPK